MPDITPITEAWALVGEKTRTLEARPKTVVLAQGQVANEAVLGALSAAGATPVVALAEAEVILLVGDNTEGLTDLPGWFELPAVQEHEVYVVEPTYFAEPQVETARIIATILHPQVFTEMLPPFSVSLAPVELFTHDTDG